MKKILMKLISAKATLEYYSGLEREFWVEDAIKDIDNAMDEIMRKYEDKGEDDEF